MLTPITIACLPKCAMASVLSSRDLPLRHDTRVINQDLASLGSGPYLTRRFDDEAQLFRFDRQRSPAIARMGRRRRLVE